jgi:outer membrane protein TolC
LEAAEDAYRIGEERYRAGLSGYLSVLNVETQVLAARRDTVDILADQAVARVTLLLALGGSFDPAATGAPVASPQAGLIRDQTSIKTARATP